jgi:hypothetical protein
MIFPGESDWEFRPPQRSQVFSVDVPDLPGVRSSLSIAFERLATSDDEVDLVVGFLECTVGVAPFGRRRLLLPVAVLEIVVILASSIIASVVVTIIVAIVTTITSVAPVGAVVATVVVASVVAAIVAAIITSIPIVVARIGSTVTIISSIRFSVTVVEALTTIAVVVVVAPSLLGGRWYSKGTV